MMRKFKLLKQFYQQSPLLQKVLPSTYLILCILTLVFCRDISEYTSGGDINTWFYHFTIVERTSMLLLLLSVFKEVKKISWIIGELLFIFLMQDIIDRVIFDYKEININDYITIGLLVVIAIIRQINKKWKHKNL